MSHSCINCDCACYCGGDIDDADVMSLDWVWDHCEGCGCEDPEDAIDYGDEPEIDHARLRQVLLGTKRAALKDKE